MIDVWNISSSLGDVDARVLVLPVLGELVQALVRHQLERLVADLGQPHVADVLGA
jgi:hypothetical protein